MVKLETNMGDIVLELDEDKAPKTVANFLEYVAARPLRWHYFSPGDRWFHDSGRRYDHRHEREIDPGADR